MNIRLVTVIWGADFVSMFLRVGLRSLLAEGNLIDLARRHQIVYSIYTTEDDASSIEASPFFSTLTESVNVQFQFFTRLEIDSAHYGSHNLLWQRGVDVARRNKEILFFLIPDLLYGKGTLLRWASRFEDGCRALYTPGPQVVMETVLPEVEEIFPSNIESITLSAKDITRLLLKHLHPMHAGMIRDTRRRVPFAEYDIRPVEGLGFVFRELSAQPFCLDPAYFEQLVNFSPADHLDMVITEPCSTLSVEPLCKRIEWYYRPWRLDDARLTNLGGWWDHFAPPGCQKDSKVAHEIALNDGSDWRAAKAQAVHGGNFFRHQMEISGQHYRLVCHLQALGLFRSAAFLCMAMYEARLRRRLNLSGAFVLLVPSDKAFSKLPNDTLKKWLTSGQEEDLINLLKDHILPGGQAGGMGSWLSARGLPIQELASRVQVIDGPINANGYSIHIIDSVLDRDGLLQQHDGLSEAFSERVIVDPVAGVQSTKSNRVVGAWGYPAWAQGSQPLRWAYLAFHVPILEALLAVPFYFFRLWTQMVRQSAKKLRSVLRPIVKVFERALIRAARPLVRQLYYRIRSIPVVGRLTGLILQAYKVWRLEGKKQLIQKCVRYLGGRRRFVKTSQNIELALSLLTRAKHVYRTQGFFRAIKWVFVRLYSRARNLNDTMIRVDEASARKLGDVQVARSLLAMSDILTIYVNSALPRELGSPPLRLVEQILQANGLDVTGNVKLEEILKSLAKRNPRWAECWLELAYIAMDRGDKEGALQYLERSSRAQRVTSTIDYIHPAAKALTEKARILRDSGVFEDALNCYSASLSRDPRQSFVFLEYARLLRQTGREIESLECFVNGIAFDEVRSYLPRGGRDVRQFKLFEH